MSVVKGDGCLRCNPSKLSWGINFKQCLVNPNRAPTSLNQIK